MSRYRPLAWHHTRRGRLFQRLSLWNEARSDWCLRRDFRDTHWAWKSVQETGVPVWLCGLSRMHTAVDDHCARPEHRYCSWCHKPMPTAASGGAS